MRVFIILVVLLPFVFSCSENKHEKGVHLYKMQCAACHELPNIEHLPKSLWKDKVLPEMGARMGMKNTGFDPLSGFSFEEQHAILNSGVYSVEPQISEADWQLLKEYIVSTAPDSLILNNSQKQAKKLSGFELVPVDIDSVHGSSIVFTQFDTEKSKLNIADLRGRIYEYREDTKTLKKILNGIGPISDFTEMDDVKYATSIGSLSPSEIANGIIFTIKDKSVQPIPLDFLRPVHTTVFDFNNDGEDEILVCEYGNLTGSLSLVVKSDDDSLEKKILLGQPGAIRTVVKDMNQDAKADIVVLTAQGNEGITILYQTENLEFKTEQVIRYSPLYGSSWFEMLDFDDDGDQDIVTLHGDNADRTQVLKPYHGLRIHLNDGANNFKEEFFYPLYGATRSVSADFDKDGDIDFGIVSTFPDYEGQSQKSFVYLNNIDTNNFVFETQVIENDFQGRWFLMDSGDFDQDGDIDIALSCSTFNFNSVPADLSKIYKENPWDILVLKNRLIE